MKGDLVRVPQSSKLYSASAEVWRQKVLKTSEIAILLKHGAEKSVVLLNDAVWEVMTKDIRLYGDKHVH